MARPSLHARAIAGALILAALTGGGGYYVGLRQFQGEIRREMLMELTASASANAALLTYIAGGDLTRAMGLVDGLLTTDLVMVRTLREQVPADQQSPQVAETLERVRERLSALPQDLLSRKELPAGAPAGP